MRKAVLVTLVSVLTAWAASAEQFDLVLKGGRASVTAALTASVSSPVAT
jgi:hypothetical protein